MTNRTSRKEKYTLPETVNPPDQICVSVPCPNERFYIAALMGALYDLTKPYNWQNDPDHTALDVAAVWKPIIDDVMLATRNPICGIQTPTVLCISGSFADEDYGWVPTLAAPCSPAYVPGTGFQSCFYAPNHGDKLYVMWNMAASTYVRSYKVLFSGTPGIAFTATANFYLGGSLVHTDTASFPAGGGGQLATSPGLQVDRLEILLDNTSAFHATSLTLTDWSLCYTGDFPLSQPPDQWTVVKDFTLSNGGFTAVLGGDGLPRAVYQAGIGWSKCTVAPCVAANISQIAITKTLAAAHRFTSVEVFCTTGAALTSGGLFTFTYPLSYPASTPSVPFLVDTAQSVMRTDLCCATYANNPVLTKLIFKGLGAVPSDL